MAHILEYIPLGHENAVTYDELSNRTGMCRRDIREAISRARRDDVILNMQDGKGFFKPTVDEADLVDRWLFQEESRLKEHAKSLKSARRYVKGK